MPFLYFLEKLRCPLLDAFFSLITHLGEDTAFMAVGMIVFWCVNKYKGYYLLCVGFFGTVANQFLKMVCRVPRPWVKDPSFTIVESAREAASGYSFPSGHTQTAVGMFGGIARMTGKRWIRIGAVAIAALVALSRMYLGVHTPADVLFSVGFASVLIFVAYPLFQRAERSPRVMYTVLFTFCGIMIAYFCWVMLNRFPEEVYAVDAAHNLYSARKNAYTLLGCALGVLAVYTADEKWIHFETKAVWWVQIIKIVGGLSVLLVVKELLRAPLEALLVNPMIARCVRYFLICVVGGVLWPMSFRTLAEWGESRRAKRDATK